MEIVKNDKRIEGLVDGNVLSSPEFLIAQGAQEWGYFIDGGQILPFCVKKKKVFTYMVFTTKVWGTKDKVEEQHFLNNVVSYVRNSMKVDFILSQHVTALFNIYPKDARFCRFGSYIIDLTLDIDDLWAKMHVKHRNVVRKAIKENVVISCDSINKKNCIELIQNTLIRQGVSAINPLVIDQLDEIKNVDYWLAEHNGKIEGAAIILWSIGGSAYYMYGGSSFSPHAGAMNLLQWEVICKMKERGVVKYDFVGARINPPKGSKYEGIQRFKERFGGELCEGFLWKMPLNRFKYWLYVLAVKIITKGAFKGDVIDQEVSRGN